jgi:hypothetical protein
MSLALITTELFDERDCTTHNDKVIEKKEALVKAGYLILTLVSMRFGDRAISVLLFQKKGKN